MDNSKTPEVNSGARPPTLNIKKLVSNYVRLRDRKRELEDAYKKQVEPFTKLMAEVEGQLLEHMQSADIDSVATPGGTCYRSTVPRATIRDGAAFRQWVVQHSRFELVDWRANARAVFDFISENNGASPPGVNASTFTSIRFRRPGEED
jgi:hypothetical protein